MAELDTADRSAETRQYNSRLPVGVYQVLRFVADRRGMSLGRLVEGILTSYAAEVLEEARQEAAAAIEAAHRDARALDQISAEYLTQSANQRLPGHRRGPLRNSSPTSLPRGATPVAKPPDESTSKGDADSDRSRLAMIPAGSSR